MVDEPNSNDIPQNDPLPDHDPQSTEADGDSEDAPRIKRRRPVYEPTLFKDKKRFRVPKLVAIPALIVACGFLFYLLVIVPKQRHHFHTVGEIVYSADPSKTGETHLYIMNNDGTGVRELSSGSGSDSQPAFAPDGNQIAFVSNRDDPTKQLYIIDPDGSNREQVTRTVGVKGSPVYAPSDFNTIGYTDAGILETLNTVSMSSSRILPPVEKKDQAGLDTLTGANIGKTITSFAWSPDKDQTKQGIAAVEEFNGDDRLLLQPTLDSDPIVSTDGTPSGPPLMSAQDMSLAWSPDGTAIAVAMIGVVDFPGGGPFSGILFVDRNGKPVQTPPLFNIPNDTTGPQSPVYSPDGTRIVCDLDQQPDVASTIVEGVGFAKVDGSVPPKMAIRGDLEQPKFSPDGAYLYFVALRKDGGHDLVRADMKQGVLKRISDGTVDVTSYDVSPQVTP